MRKIFDSGTDAKSIRHVYSCLHIVSKADRERKMEFSLSPFRGPCYDRNHWKKLYFIHRKGSILLSSQHTDGRPAKSKKIHIEFLRILCIWLVMFTHSSTSGFSLYLAQQTSPWFPLYLLVPFWVKTAVPIFFMVSGALLLGKDEPISVIFRKRISRFVQVILVFSLINYIFFYAVPEHHFSLLRYLSITYTSNMATAYYFLYIYVSFLLMLPLWRAMVRSLTNTHYLYLIGLNLFFVGFIPVFSFLLFRGQAEMNGFLNPLLAISEPSFYFIIGYWMENVLPDSWITKRNLCRLGLAAAAGTVIAAVMTWFYGYTAGGLTEAISQRFYDSFLFLNTAFLYCFCRYWFRHHEVSDTWKRRLIFLGSLSFGVMLFEEITRAVTHRLLTQVLLVHVPGFPFLDAVVWITTAFALGAVMTWLIKKIPYFQKLI